MRYPKNRDVKPKGRAGRPNYSLPNRYYPEYMPASKQGKNWTSNIWHMRRILRFKLGYIAIDGERCDEWETYSPDKIAYYHKLIDWADQLLKEKEQEYYDRLREKKEEYYKLRTGILSDIYDQTDAFLEKRKNLNTVSNKMKGIDMAKMTFDEMMDWADKQKEFDGGGINWLKLTQGIHCVRLVCTEDDDYFRSYTQHDCGQESSFRSWLCWDWILDNKEIADYFEEKGILKDNDVRLAKKYGDPVCNTLEAIKKYVKDMGPIIKILRTKTRCIFNTIYIYQAYPELDPSNKRDAKQMIMPGNYILEKSAMFNKLIIGAMHKEISTSKNKDAISLNSSDRGKLLAIQVEGEGIGKNKRTYSIDYKGERGPIIFCEDGTNPYVEDKEILTLPDDFEVYNLLDAVSMRYLPYQEVINQLKQIPTIAKLIDQIGYDIPGDSPSDNPLDDNYDKKYAKKLVGRPIAEVKLKEDSPIRKAEKRAKEDWEDEDNIKKEKKQVQSKKVVQVEEDDEEEEIFDEDEIEVEEKPKKKNAFEKAVPPSDPELEVIKPKSSKRKIF